MIDISPVFKDLLEIAWGSHYGNIRIAGNGGKPSLSWHRAAELETVSQSEGTHAFWSTSSFITPVSPAKKSDMSHVGILWVDIDDSYAKLTNRTDYPQPNFIIHTSPDKAHLFYVIDPVSIQSPKEINLLEAVQSALSVHLGGDKGSRDLGHISRVPGSINPKNGYEVHIEQLHSRVYTLAELNPEALAPGEGRHHDAVKKLASAVARGEDPAETLEQLETVAYTEPFDEEEREGLLDMAENMDVAQYAPEPVEGINIEAWDRKGTPSIGEYVRQLGDFNVTFNVIGGRLMLNKATMTDGMFSVLFDHFHTKNFRVEGSLIHALKSTAERKERFNPIIDWIEREEWDGEDHIAKLASYFTDDGTGDFAAFLPHWLVGAVAKVAKPEGAFNRMLVLEGRQGIGKSEFAKWLVPSALLDYFCQDVPNFDHSSKDTIIKSTNKWIWEIQELGQHTSKYQDQLKAFLSQVRVGERIPYDKFPMDETTRASYIGTINNLGGFLTDPTGNRRYMAVSIWDIDWQGYTKEVNLRQVWAQALQMFKDGFEWELSGEIEARANDANATYVIASPLAEVIEAMYEIDPEDTSVWVKTSEVMEAVGNRLGRDFSVNEIAGALAHLGSRQMRKREGTKNHRVWTGVKERVKVTIE